MSGKLRGHFHRFLVCRCYSDGIGKKRSVYLEKLRSCRGSSNEDM
jgi:hypothetical protein